MDPDSWKQSMKEATQRLRTGRRCRDVVQDQRQQQTHAQSQFQTVPDTNVYYHARSEAGPAGLPSVTVPPFVSQAHTLDPDRAAMLNTPATIEMTHSFLHMPNPALRPGIMAGQQPVSTDNQARKHSWEMQVEHAGRQEHGGVDAKKSDTPQHDLRKVQEIAKFHDTADVLVQNFQDFTHLFGQGHAGDALSDLPMPLPTHFDQDLAPDASMEDNGVAEDQPELPAVNVEDNDSHEERSEEPTFVPPARRSPSPLQPVTPKETESRSQEERSYTPTSSPPLQSPTLLDISRSDFHIDSFGFTFHTLVINTAPPLFLASEISSRNIPNYEHRNHYHHKRYYRNRAILEMKLAGIKIVGPQDNEPYIRNRLGKPPLYAREILGLYECEHWPGVGVQVAWTSWLIQSARAHEEGRRYPKLPRCTQAVYKVALHHANKHCRRADDDWLLRTVLNVWVQIQLIALSTRLARNAVKDFVLLSEEKAVRYVRRTTAVYRVGELKMPTETEVRQRNIRVLIDQWGAEAVDVKSKVSNSERSKKRVPDWLGGSAELMRTAGGKLDQDWMKLHDLDVMLESFAAKPSFKAWPPSSVPASVRPQPRDQPERRVGAGNEGSAANRGLLPQSSNSACPDLPPSSKILGKRTHSLVEPSELDQIISKSARVALPVPSQRQNAAMAEPQDVNLAEQMQEELTKEEPSIVKVKLQLRGAVAAPMSYPPAPGQQPHETSELLMPPSASTRQYLAGPRLTHRDFIRPVTLDTEVLHNTRAKMEALVTQVHRYEKEQRRHIYLTIASLPAWNRLPAQKVMEGMLSYHNGHFRQAENDWRRIFDIHNKISVDSPLRRQYMYLSYGLMKANRNLLTPDNKELFVKCCQMEAYKVQLEVMKEWTANLDVMRFNYVQKKGNMLFRHEKRFTFDLKHDVIIPDDAVVKDREMEDERVKVKVEGKDERSEE